MKNWRKILEENTDLVFPSGRDEVNILCPFHEEKHPSCSINLRKGLFICHTGCSQGTLKDFLAMYLEKDYLSISKMLHSKEIFDDSFELEKDEQIELPLAEVKIPFDSRNFPKWILDRGFTEQIAKKWKFGQSREGSLVIPVQSVEGKNVGWVCRRKAGIEPRYVYSIGLKTSALLFGENYLSTKQKFLCVTEGILDTIWLDQNGFDSVGLFGTNMSKIQERRLVSLKREEIVLCLDNDEPGRIAEEKIYQRLNKYVTISQISLPKQYKDVQDVRKISDLHSIINQRSIF